MTDSHELVIDLPCFGGKLHFIGEMLPFAPAAYAKMLTKRFEPMFRRLYQPFNPAFQIVLFPLGYTNIDHIPGNAVFHKQNSGRGRFTFRRKLGMGESFAFSSHAFDGYVFNDQSVFHFEYKSNFQGAQR